ncbi:hypothetical protein TNCV_3383971 [Trichonephila clavipes]|uniref:Uncharacterized protein n=1 Tax=Trichonephila clavipes TaxID=2585209 RepID=A0A8X6VQU6_TRICX|nr:hypothetical protein TNCV_3383971 [Trichonephila clavipes]
MKNIRTHMQTQVLALKPKYVLSASQALDPLESMGPPQRKGYGGSTNVGRFKPGTFRSEHQYLSITPRRSSSRETYRYTTGDPDGVRNGRCPVRIYTYKYKYTRRKTGPGSIYRSFGTGELKFITIKSGKSSLSGPLKAPGRPPQTLNGRNGSVKSHVNVTLKGELRLWSAIKCRLTLKEVQND